MSVVQYAMECSWRGGDDGQGRIDDLGFEQRFRRRKSGRGSSSLNCLSVVFPYSNRQFIKNVHYYVIDALWVLGNRGLEQVEAFSGIHLKWYRSVCPCG